MSTRTSKASFSRRGGRSKKSSSPEWDGQFFRTPMKPQRPPARRRYSPLVAAAAAASPEERRRTAAVPALARVKSSLSNLWQRIVHARASEASATAVKDGTRAASAEGQRTPPPPSSSAYSAFHDSPTSSTKLYSPFAIETPPEPCPVVHGRSRKLVYAD